ncbi:MAG: hypothetical protein SFZ23_09800 [Planctomycetota bacterium]|nr:hypothetical protein [Planctomycetota bacterium]
MRRKVNDDVRRSRATDMGRLSPAAGLVAGLVVIVSATEVGVAQRSVAIVAAANASTTDVRFTDVRQKLEATGLLCGGVGVFNASQGTPTLAELSQYGAVLVWSNVDFLDELSLGNALADYVDRGGGVVVALFANTSTDPDRSIKGRWESENYHIVPPAFGNASGNASLGNVLIPNHPIMSGVQSVTGGTQMLRPTTREVTAHGVKVALWDDGSTLVAISSRFRSRVDLGLYPPSNVVVPGYWSPSSDVARLMANALNYAAGCPADLDGNNQIDFFDYLEFVAAFAEESIRADFDCNNQIDLFDYLGFAADFASGCE